SSIISDSAIGAGHPQYRSVLRTLVDLQIPVCAVDSGDLEDNDSQAMSLTWHPLGILVDGERRSIRRAVAMNPVLFERPQFRDPPGGLSRNMFVRYNMEGKKPCICAINLTSESRKLKLRGNLGGAALFEDRLSAETHDKDDPMTFSPWQVRLLVPKKKTRINASTANAG
ncbi:MAG: hypothetical protein ACPGXK_07950, partial [Phycisphaerae bacterium]